MEIKNIVSMYGDTEILHNLNMKIDEGKTIALIGRNGAGKSTLFKTIYGLLKPKRGTINYTGKQIQHLQSYQIKELGISYMPQGARVFPNLSVEENLRCLLNKGQTYDLTFEHLRDLIHDSIVKRDSYFVRMVDSLLGAHKNQTAGTLSGGQRQIICLLRNLINDSKLLLWDEPSIGLSQSLLPELLSIMNYLKQKGKTILLIDQKIEWALNSSDVAYVMQKGEIKYFGTPDVLLKDRICLLQLLGLGTSDNEKQLIVN